MSIQIQPPSESASTPESTDTEVWRLEDVGPEGAGLLKDVFSELKEMIRQPDQELTPLSIESSSEDASQAHRRTFDRTTIDPNSKLEMLYRNLRPGNPAGNPTVLMFNKKGFLRTPTHGELWVVLSGVGGVEHAATRERSANGDPNARGVDTLSRTTSIHSGQYFWDGQPGDSKTWLTLKNQTPDDGKFVVLVLE